MLRYGSSAGEPLRGNVGVGRGTFQRKSKKGWADKRKGQAALAVSWERDRLAFSVAPAGSIPPSRCQHGPAHPGEPSSGMPCTRAQGAHGSCGALGVYTRLCRRESVWPTMSLRARCWSRRSAQSARGDSAVTVYRGSSDSSVSAGTVGAQRCSRAIVLRSRTGCVRRRREPWCS